MHPPVPPRKESRIPTRRKKPLLRYHRKALEQGNKLWGIFLLVGFLLNFLLPIVSLSSAPGFALFFKLASGLYIAFLIFSLLIGVFQGYLSALLLFARPRERTYLYCSVSFFLVAAAKMLSMCFVFDLMQLLGLPAQVAFGIIFLRKATSIKAIEEFEQRDSGQRPGQTCSPPPLCGRNGADQGYRWIRKIQFGFSISLSPGTPIHQRVVKTECRGTGTQKDVDSNCAKNILDAWQTEKKETANVAVRG